MDTSIKECASTQNERFQKRMLDRMNVCQNQSYSTSKLLISRNLNAWVWRQIMDFTHVVSAAGKKEKNNNRREEHFNPASSLSKKKSFLEAIYLQIYKPAVYKSPFVGKVYC